MPKHKVTFMPGDLAVEVSSDSYPYGGDGQPGSLLDIAMTHGVEITHACGGVGACGTCHVIIEQGMENLSEATDEELDMVDTAPGSTPNSRLACQAIVNGDVVVTVPGWNRNA